jgi:predicted alpha/beta superfamily hydrolase
MSNPDAVSLLATERHTMKSIATGETYEISIALPYAYVPDTASGGPFPGTRDAWHAIYLTDANWHMGMVTEFVRECAWCGRSSDAIVVGIGYPQAESPQASWRSVYAARSLDLTPVRIEDEEESGAAWIKRPVKTGGGSNFLQFLQQELIPWVEQTYRADPAKRVLVGHSYGALFALYAMFQDATLFHGYLAASPFLRNQEPSVYTMEKEFAKNHKDLAAQVYLAAGELENSPDDPTLTDIYRLGALLASRNFPGLVLKTQVFADNNHCEVAAPALHAGLKMMLKK